MLLSTSPALRASFFALPPSLRRACYATATSPSASHPEIFDLVCVGGGPAGLSLISSLKSQASTKGLKIALIDAQNLSAPLRTGDGDASGTREFSNRCSSLTPASVKFLKRIGAWDNVALSRVQAYTGMEVWDGVSGAKINFDPMDRGRVAGVVESLGRLVPGSGFGRGAGDEGEGEVATMCENSNLTAALVERVRGLEGVEVLDGTKVEGIELGPEKEKDGMSLDLSLWPVLRLPGNRKIAARLLVGADGANSPVRTFADIPSKGWDYNQHGVVATLQLDQVHDVSAPRKAYQRFLPTGPIALLPLPGNKASLVWSTTTALASHLKSLPPAEFTAAVNAAFRLLTTDISYMLTHSTASQDLEWRESQTDTIALGLPAEFPRVEGVVEGSVASFPLRMRHASTYTGHRIALIGDAAHTIHPLAGQGLNLGLADAESLARHLAIGMEAGMDIGSCWCLDGYGSDRWGKNNAVMGVVDKVGKVFGASAGPVVWARSLGFNAVERLGWVKGGLMRGASG
ncbi:putative ubiquinone biosynthesis monooxygenase [Oleoguttula sp. CCFEE 5521]